MTRTILPATLVLALVSKVLSQSTVSVFLLDSDVQSLVASAVGVANSLTTLSARCADGVDSSDCGYPSGFSVTYGPSTVHLVAVSGAVTGEFGCQLTGTVSGACSVTYVGPANQLTNVIDDTEVVTATTITTISTSAALTSGDITLIPITVTAGALVGGAGTASNTAAGSTGTETAVSNTASTGSSSSHSTGTGGTASTTSSQGTGASSRPTSTTSTSSFNVGSQLIAPGMLGAALLGFAAWL